MTFTEQEKHFIRNILPTEDAKLVFKGLMDKKIMELTNAATFKKIDNEKDMTIELVYGARMASALYLKDFAEELFRIANETKRDNPVASI